MGKIFEALEKSKYIAADRVEHKEMPFLDDDLKQKGLSEESTMTVDNGSNLSIAEPDPVFLQHLDASLVTLTKTNSIEAEQFRLLKNNILFPEKGTPPEAS